MTAQTGIAVPLSSLFAGADGASPTAVAGEVAMGLFGPICGFLIGILVAAIYVYRKDVLKFLKVMLNVFVDAVTNNDVVKKPGGRRDQKLLSGVNG